MDKSFKEIVSELRAAEYTDAQLARLCNCTRQHIGKIGKGTTIDPGFRIGARLTKLHEAIQ